MPIIKNSEFYVLEKFPGRGEEIKRLFRESEVFQSVCEDYRQCAEALSHWRQSAEKDAPVRRQEYEVLLQDLLEELLQCLNEFQQNRNQRCNL